MIEPTDDQDRPILLRPSRSVTETTHYQVPRHPAPIDLKLDSNEGAESKRNLFDELHITSLSINRYPSKRELTQELARHFKVDQKRILVTAGADDALDRACRAFLGSGRSLVYPKPSFEMIPRFVAWSQGDLIKVDWNQRFPIAEVISSIREDTTLITLVSPNNPTGAVVSKDELLSISAAAPQALILLDHAYVDFVDDATLDLTTVALTLPNVCVFRTFSKAWGLASARVGFVMGPELVIEWLTRVGNPYSVAGPSLLLAFTRFTRDQKEVERSVEQVKLERKELRELLRSLGIHTRRSHGNFIYMQTPKALWIRDALAGVGISVRAWPQHAELNNSLRVTCPGNSIDQNRLIQSLETALRPEAILFDLDGVIADVSESYRATIMETCATYGVSLTASEVAEVKGEGDANNDWIVSQRLLSRRGIQTSLSEVTKRFERIYQGDSTNPGLYQKEQMIPSFSLLSKLSQRLAIAIVTGRPKRDAEVFLTRFKLKELFSAVIVMEDAPLKPNPAPVKLALSQLGIERAWMIGDTVDDIRAARQSAVIPLGVIAPADPNPSLARSQLLAAGASRVLDQLDDLLELLP